MALPNPGMVAVPFDIYTAEEVNDTYANIEALADGSGLADGAVTADKVGFTTCYIVEHLFDNSTGTQTITGVPFKPSAIEVTGLVVVGGVNISLGVAQDGGTQSSKVVTATTSTGNTSNDSAAFTAASTSTGNVIFRGSVTSFNSNGISVNVTLSTSTTSARTFVIKFFL